MRSLLFLVIFTILIAFSYGQAHSAATCINACGNTWSSANTLICNQCAANPPIEFSMCKYACGNTISSQNTIICNKCVTQMPLTSEWCTHACGNTISPQLTQVCNRCRV
ncbi:hypothetical protein ACTFIV_000284 [Dictyostelium citrinum]